ncbi:MAG TPA: site-specific DNA-methyltransferase [Ktedonobacteraceae bacterium]|nr:site-specific DNA-methyltransferase [Ktedonobacteraceae bacterium]
MMFSPLFQSNSDHHSITIAEDYDPSNAITLHRGNSLAFLRTIPDESIALVVTSPPYNIGKVYEQKQDITAYLAEQEMVIHELKRILTRSGSICWQTGNYVDDGEVFPLDVYYYHMFKKQGLKLRNRIIWHFEHGLHASKRFSGRYETILWFSKTDDYTFNLDPVRVPAKYPGKRHFKGPNRGQLSGNPLGKNPADIWEFLYEEWESCLWDIPNVKANHIEKTLHPCQFPVELVERCVLALTNEHDRVLDPYCGVGSTLIAALMHERKAVGVDKEQEYIDISRERVYQLSNGTLKTRPLGRPVHKPSGREKITQVPLEWKRQRIEEE